MLLSITRAVLSKDGRELTETQIKIGLAALLFNPFGLFLSEEILANKMMGLEFTSVWPLGLAVELLFLAL